MAFVLFMAFIFIIVAAVLMDACNDTDDDEWW